MLCRPDPRTSAAFCAALLLLAPCFMVTPVQGSSDPTFAVQAPVTGAPASVEPVGDGQTGGDSSLADNATGARSEKSARADNPDGASPAVFHLPQVAVKGRTVAAPPALVVREVSLDDIRSRNAHTVGEALVHVPGVNVQVGGTSGDARAWIRGYRDRDVLVLFDGIPIASGFEGTIDLNEIAVQRVSAIKVMKSAPSVIYGTNGVGGVIDILPQGGVSEAFLDGRLEAGGDGHRYARASAGGGDRFRYTLSAQHQRADEYSLSDDFVPELNQPSGDRRNSDFERSSLFFQLEAADTMFGDTSLFINLADAEKGLAVETGVPDPDFERLTQSRRQTVGLSNQFNNLPLSLKLYYNAYDSELTAYTDATYSRVDEVETTEDYAFGGKLYATLETSDSNVVVMTASAQTDVFIGEGELEDGNRAELTTYTVAMEDEFWITETFSLAAGGIFTHFDQTRLGRSSNEFNPQVALAWQATPRLSLHASIAERTRFPKLRELYRRRYGNPDLEPQTAVNYEFGLALRHRPGWSSDISLFHSEIDGLIERADRRALYTNFEPVTISGVEAATSARVSNIFTRFAYTYVDASEDLPDGGSRQLRSRPRHTAMAELRYHFSAAGSLSFSGIRVSGLHDLEPDNSYRRLPSYFLANLKASWAVTPRHELYVALTNLGDTDYLQRLGDPREGRRLMLGLNFGY